MHSQKYWLYSMYKMMLNPVMVEKQGLSRKEQLKIIVLHEEKNRLIGEMRDATDNEKIRELADRITEVEYSLQKSWGFQLDANYHRWYDLPHCSCPKVDNEERWGTSQPGIYNADCIIHGSCCVQYTEEFVI